MEGCWVEQQFQCCQLGDARLTRRLIKLGKACLARPDGSLPQKFGTWTNTKAGYRFFNSKKVSHSALQTAHYSQTLTQATERKRVLFIQDGSELLYNHHPYTFGLGATADADGQGIMFHSCLTVAWAPGQEPEVIGLARQTAYIRGPKEERMEKESRLWLDSLKQIGPPPEGVHWITVGDRASDIYEFIQGARELKWDFVLRCKHNRAIVAAGQNQKLFSWIRNLPSEKGYELDLRARGDQFSRRVSLSISWASGTMKPPKGGSEQGEEVTYVRVFGDDLEWILATSLPITNREEALDVVRAYEQRWMIEEYHKCLKTGCRIEDAQLKNGDRLLALFGLLGVIAIQLLRLRDLGRREPEKPAGEVLTEDVVEFIKKVHKHAGELTARECVRYIAKLGGFLARRSDGEPGWQTIWRGRLRLQDMMAGFDLAKQLMGND